MEEIKIAILVRPENMERITHEVLGVNRVLYDLTPKPTGTIENELYQSTEKEVDETLNELQKAGLSREQNKVVDRALSATNASGAAYGATAYKQGLYDGIKLMSEVKRISEIGSVLGEQDHNYENAI